MADIRDRWFKNHVAKFLALGENIYRIKWAAPGSNTYSIRFILDHGTLLIWGDLGEAVYQWAKHDLTFDELANFDLHYFAGKLQASEDGREFYSFDLSNVIEELRTLREENEAVRKEIGDDDVSRLECEDEARALLMRLTFLESETLSSILDSGKTLHPRLVSHWLGVRMAVAYLQRIKAPSPAHQP